ncbi:hypothetical protein DET49_14016 [Salegentibacter sp. 24]|uniref:hypothetical protein n=1 Tax=Salegentibacter sp. 24 TaxID=2183986 RepID=UPI00105C0C39|nr:hypothetical protein [Salegentibacter sp. 24]TDN79081.1 hypothetical protein DET49_14016 [Salegentibacter sp. 24]
MSFDLFKYLTTLGFFYIYGRLILHYGELFLVYMLEDKILWKSHSEKPRILFLIIGLGFMHLMSFTSAKISPENYLFQFIILLAYGVGFYFAFVTWTDQFSNNMQVKVALPLPEKTTFKKADNFQLKISEGQLEKLYQGLMKYDLLYPDKTSLQDFENALTKDWNTHDSKIHFKMDGPSSREFYEFLSTTFSNQMTIKDLFIKSGVVLRSDGKKYKYNTLKNAPIRTPVSKQNDALIDIFKKLS